MGLCGRDERFGLLEADRTERFTPRGVAGREDDQRRKEPIRLATPQAPPIKTAVLRSVLEEKSLSWASTYAKGRPPRAPALTSGVAFRPKNK